MILNRIDPTTRLLALAVLTTPLLLSIDLISATVAVAGIFLLAPLCGMGPIKVLRRGWPLLVLAPLTGLSMLLYGRAGGEIYLDAGPITVTANSVKLALAVTVRVFAVGLPAVVLTHNMDPTRLGDGLAQLWKLPSRFVIGSVAGVRMVTLFQQDWSALDRARRARGLGDGPRISKLPKQAFALLVLALRRGSKLATAMEARGFGATDTHGRPLPRTWGRKATFGMLDLGVILACAALSAVALGAAVWTGDFRLLGVTGS